MEGDQLSIVQRNRGRARLTLRLVAVGLYPHVGGRRPGVYQALGLGKRG